MKSAAAMLAVATFFTTFAVAQVKLPPRPEDFRPSLTVTENDHPRALGLQKADVHVVITGFIAQTTMTLTFHNDLSRALEGELVFPLPQGATICGYGLDVNGQMVDGVPVEKQQARIAFESEVRKGIDPGLVEQVKGNNFRTRIFPIPAKGNRTVKVQYVSDLNGSGEDCSYLLPTNWGDKAVGEYHIKVEMHQAPAAPMIRSAPADLAFTGPENQLVAEKTFKEIKLTKDLVISLPNPPAQHVLVEDGSREKEEGTAGTFFVVNDLVVPPVVQKAKRHIDRIAIAWDASLSRAKRDKAREFELIRRIAGKYRNFGVDLIVVRNIAEPPVAFDIHDGDASELIKHLSSLQYDGGTNLSSLKMEKNRIDLGAGAWRDRPTDYSFWLVFTDGLSDLFADRAVSAKLPVYAVSDDARSNHELLEALAQSSGGEYLNLQRLSVDQAAAAVGDAPYSFLSAEFDPAKIAEVYPRTPRAVHGRFAIAGRLLATEAKITLNYGIGDQVMHRQTIALRKSAGPSTGLAARFWAQQKLAELLSSPEKNRERILALGREFNLVTPNTSLMVLETLAQYVRYNITPPKSRPELYQAYQSQVAQREQARKQSQAKKIDTVLEMWGQRVAWWEKQYRYAQDFTYIAPPAPKLAEGGLDVRSPAPAASNRTDAGVPGQADHANRAFAARAAQESVAFNSRPAAVHDLAAVDARGLNAGGDAMGDGIAIAGRLRTKTDAHLADLHSAAISLAPWNPETPYLNTFRDTPSEKLYAVYLQQRDQFGSSPAFYLDCADFFLEQHQRDLAIRILTNIAELQLDSAPLTRVAAHRLMQIKEYDLAIDLFEQVLKLRPEEPQSPRDLALALEARALADPASPMAQADLRRAAKLLQDVVMGSWDGRFPQIEVIALEELNELLAKARSIPSDKPISADLDPRLLRLLDMDVRIVLTWDADLTDIDLWVTEPSGEKCMYNHNRTTIGGLISNDFTQGYGPEEYCLRKAMKGEYKIQCNFYGSRQQSLTGPTTIQATVITNFGRPDEKRKSLTVRLAKQKDVVDLGAIRIE